MKCIIKPHRGSSALMKDSKKDTVLAKGELFMEYPDTGVGTGKVLFKVGDGSTAYSALPYALGTKEEAAVISFTDDTSATAAEALNKVVATNTLAGDIAAIKQAAKLINSASTTNGVNITNLTTQVNNLTIVRLVVIEYGNSLPSVGAVNTLYLLSTAASATKSATDTYDMYVWCTGGFYNKVGGRATVDLTAYAKSTDVDTKLAAYEKTADLTTLLASYATTEALTTAVTALEAKIKTNADEITELQNASTKA